MTRGAHTRVPGAGVAAPAGILGDLGGGYLGLPGGLGCAHSRLPGDAGVQAQASR